MQEDKREKVRLASDVMFRGMIRDAINLNPKCPYPPYPYPVSELELSLAEARERARLSVLKLTERDKRFLKAMKIAV